MDAGRLFADEQRRGDPTVARSVVEEGEHLSLARRQPTDGGQAIGEADVHAGTAGEALDQPPLTDGSEPPSSTSTEPSTPPPPTTITTTTGEESTTTTTTGEESTTTTEPPVGDLTVDVEVLARCIDTNGRGVIPVLVYGSPDVDLSALDVTSVALSGMPIVTVYGFPLAIPLDVDGDGSRDLLVLIRNVAGAIPAGTTTVTLTALLEDGTPIAGSDSICGRR